MPEIARRDFLQRSAGTLAGLALGASPRSLWASQGSPRRLSSARSLDLLLLGGTGFLGPHQIRYALERGHRVSIFNRGPKEPRMFRELFREVEHLQGDRGGDLTALRGRSWDAVLDNSGQDVQWAPDSAEALAGSVQRYLFVSSTGCTSRISRWGSPRRCSPDSRTTLPGTSSRTAS